jgi:hypothetical protein
MCDNGAEACFSTSKISSPTHSFELLAAHLKEGSDGQEKNKQETETRMLLWGACQGMFWPLKALLFAS